MPEELPIACSLGAAALSERLEQMGRLGAVALIRARSEGGHAELRFRDDPGVRERVDAIAAAEAECCSFLSLAVRPDGEAVVLAIDVPAGAEPVLAEIVAAFRGEPAPA